VQIDFQADRVSADPLGGRPTQMLQGLRYLDTREGTQCLAHASAPRDGVRVGWRVTMKCTAIIAAATATEAMKKPGTRKLMLLRAHRAAR
jgi:hypothetical protein